MQWQYADFCCFRLNLKMFEATNMIDAWLNGGPNLFRNRLYYVFPAHHLVLPFVLFHCTVFCVFCLHAWLFDTFVLSEVAFLQSKPRLDLLFLHLSELFFLSLFFAQFSHPDNRIKTGFCRLWRRNGLLLAGLGNVIGQTIKQPLYKM